MLIIITINTGSWKYYGKYRRKKNVLLNVNPKTIFRYIIKLVFFSSLLHTEFVYVGEVVDNDFAVEILDADLAVLDLDHEDPVGVGDRHAIVADRHFLLDAVVLKMGDTKVRI